MESHDQEQQPVDFYLVTEEMSKQIQDEIGTGPYWPKTDTEDPDEEVNEWVDEMMMQFPFDESQRYSEWKAFRALRRETWKTSAREHVTEIVLKSNLLPNYGTDISNYLREQHRKYLALFIQSTRDNPEAIELYMFTLTREQIAYQLIGEAWTHYGPFGIDEELKRIEANPSACKPR